MSSLTTIIVEKNESACYGETPPIVLTIVKEVNKLPKVKTTYGLKPITDADLLEETNDNNK